MKGYLLLNGQRLGEVDFNILDEYMGAIEVEAAELDQEILTLFK